MNEHSPGCARCPIDVADRICQTEEGKALPFCPTQNKADIIAKAQKELDKPDVYEFARQASIQEAEGYGDREL
jgi:hypothetical protein